MQKFNFKTIASSSGSMGLMAVFTPLYWLFGLAMQGLLKVFTFEHYFIALVIFTVLTRLVLFPLNLRQQKTMAKTTRLQPKIQKIQKKYSNSKDANSRQKMNEEMQELYKREGHNPMNMGCGPMFFQMIFLMGIIGIIYYPLQYIIGITDFNDHVEAIKAAIDYTQATGRATNSFQFELLQNFDGYKAVLMEKLPDVFTGDIVSKIEAYRAGMWIGKLDMTVFPTWKSISIIIPILCLITSLGSSVVSTLIQRKNNAAASQQQTQMMLMMLMMPVFSFIISFRVSAAVGFYWIISNLVALAQQLVMAKFFPPKKNMAHEMIENTIQRRAREESIKKVKG